MAVLHSTGPGSDPCLASEYGRLIEVERHRLAKELWELREEWPHRLELRAEATLHARKAIAAVRANARAAPNDGEQQRPHLLDECMDANDLLRALFPNLNSCAS